MLSFDLENTGYGPQQAALFSRRLLDHVSAMPGIERVALARTALAFCPSTGCWSSDWRSADFSR